MDYEMTNTGFQAMQKNLKDIMADFVKNRPTPDKKWCCPPAQDPMTVCPQTGNGEIARNNVE